MSAPSWDSTPHMAAAGYIPRVDGEAATAENTLKPEFFSQAPPTPEYMRKWRKDTSPGKTCLHPGVADDAACHNIEVYGRVEPVGVKVHEVLNTAPRSHLVEKAIEKKEAIYLSHKREPLGKPYTRGHAIPAAVAGAGFGRPTPQDVGGEQSKELIHPPELVQSAQEHAQYVRSHANYNPGEQRRRGYSWVDKNGPIDSSTYSFGGLTHPRDVEGVSKLLNPSTDAELSRRQVVVEKRLEDFREVASEPLGRVKTLGHGTLVSSEQVFGMPSQKGPEWGVHECMAKYSEEDQKPDADLGCSIRPGWRNTAPEGRVFGVPSIRNDISAPSMKSITDHQNYGDEYGAGKLLYPTPYADAGVTTEDFLAPRAGGEIRAIFADAGFELDDAQFSAVFEKAADADGAVSIASFRIALLGN